MGGMMRWAIQEAVLRNEFKVYSNGSVLSQDGRRGGVPVGEPGDIQILGRSYSESGRE